MRPPRARSEGGHAGHSSSSLAVTQERRRYKVSAQRGRTDLFFCVCGCYVDENGREKVRTGLFLCGWKCKREGKICVLNCFGVAVIFAN